MKSLLCLCVVIMLTCGLSAQSGPTEQMILQLERSGMEGWLAGNPDPLLSISAPGITYMHTELATRLEGLAALKAMCEGYRGRPLYDAYEIIAPKVTVAGDTAVLSYEFQTRNGSLTRRWYATSVYQKTAEGWRVIHAHFSRLGA
jgi:hypothetical protein